MTALVRSSGASGALYNVSGTVANNATWAEDIYFRDGGVATVITGLEFKFTFRSDPNSDAADLTLSTSDSLSIVADSNGVNSILRISIAAGDLSGYFGDYVADLASKDVSDVVTLWAHGEVTFTRNPVSFG